MSVGAELRRLYDEYDDVSPIIVRQDPDASLERIEDEYGSLNQAIREVWSVDDDHYRDRMLTVARQLTLQKGEPPTNQELAEYTMYDEIDIRSEFGRTGVDDIVDDPVLQTGYKPVDDPDEDLPDWIEETIKVYGPNWLEQRELVLDRDGHRCRVCGKDGDENSLHVHHIEPRKEFVEEEELDYFEANKQSNLITLCPSCHQRVEGMWPNADPDEFAENAKDFVGNV